MSRQARSARGDIVDFDRLAIKEQLASAPLPVSVDDRRRFIDEKDGIRVKQAQQTASALTIGLEGAEQSADAVQE